MAPTLSLAPPRVTVSPHGEGGLLLRSEHPLGEPARHVCERLRHFAAVAPDRALFLERDEAGGLRRVTYAEARSTCDALAQALLDRNLSPDRPLMILSENSTDHALLMLGAMQVGVPVASISTAYSLVSRDFEKLRAIAEILGPGLVYASCAERYGGALEATGIDTWSIVTGRGAVGHSTSLDDLARTTPRADSERRHASLGPDAIAKVLFTSGSTGAPKGVVNTQRMLCSNQRAIEALWPFLRERPPVVVDWLPWSHTFGSNHNLNLVLFHGGTLLIDEGKPAPGLIERTVANLREVSPTIYFNVPRGFDVLLPHLERDADLRASFFRDLDAIFYAAASLPAPLWDRLEALGAASPRASTHGSVAMLSAWGLTETAPMATCVHYPVRRAGVIGLPAPGTDILLVPDGQKHEIRVRGPNVTPGYWKRPDLGKAAFDDEGFFRTGDAARLIDPESPALGLAFDGRIAEDFKLISGTWVHVGALRVDVVAACAPLVQDAVITGLDEREIGVLLFLSPAACAALVPDRSLEEAATSPLVRARVAEGLARHNAQSPGSSRRVGRFALLAEPPSIDAGEITDKGYINQRAVLERRRGLVEGLYADDAAALRP